MKQLSLLKHSKSFGGDLLNGIRKDYRPLTSKKPIHLVWRSEVVLEHGGFKRHGLLVRNTICRFAEKYNVKFYSLVICSNHLHAVVRYQDRREFQNFLRVMSGQVAQKISGKKGFWLNRPFTRIAEWGRDFEGSLNYLDRNQLETDGLIEHER